MRSVELFSGAGGLALAISNAGFQHEAVIEWNKDACNTIRANQKRGMDPVCHWNLFETDIKLFDYGMIPSGLDLLGGGPPCQPFSIGGKHRGQIDDRNMFPEAARAVRELQPKAFIFENVKGLLRESFAKYFEYIILQLTYPEIAPKKDEDWSDHLARLERYHTAGHKDGLYYNVVFRLVNAADYGVPQRRERVFIVGFRSDIDTEWSFPSPTHSQDALWWSQWKTGEYWERRQVATKHRPKPTPIQLASVNRLFEPELEPWQTVRDAIWDLPDPQSPGYSKNIPNHQYIPGAKVYPGHTGSPLDEPAKTLKAGDHGVPGGENMLVYPNGKVRYFTVRESARLQTFPDDFIFEGAWGETMRQLGNAVPVKLGQVITNSVKKCLLKAQ
ncbi:MAG: DNA cytosine methyltransferase [Firmicutes bacterium]|nr:DNA cytosine methyltransferase [Bacillota bacterium]